MSSADPTGSEIQQSEIPEILAVPVRVEGPVRVQLLPAVVGASSYKNITDTNAHRILRADSRRKRAIILSVDQPIYVAESDGQIVTASGSGAFLLPERIPHEITHREDVWVGLANPTGQTVVSVLHELWSE